MNRATSMLLVVALLVSSVSAEAASADADTRSTPAPSPSANASALPAKPMLDGRRVVGTVVRFTAGSTAIDVTVDRDSPAVRDFLAMLPLTLKVEEFSQREKISYLPRKLQIGSSPGSDPEDGDLIYFVPWGNIGFYYNTAGIGYSDQTIHLGTYKASVDQLRQLEGPPVRVDFAR